MLEEISSLEKHNTWDLVDLPEGKNLVGCKWVFKTKRDANGDVDRFKARLVAQGYSLRSSHRYTTQLRNPPDGREVCISKW